MDQQTEHPSYSNWFPVKLIVLLWVLPVLPLAGILAVNRFWNGKGVWLLAVIALLLAAYAAYMTAVRRTFSFRGGGVMGKIHQLVAEKLPWDGRGELLDIGCGSGALTILCAKRFPEARVMGLDYWGAVWDYAKAQCENNARIEGVPGVEFLKGDAARLPFEEGRFDAAVSNFVFHEVRTEPDKQALVREALRVLKKGGSFSFHDLFGSRRLYGDMEAFVEELKKEGISEIHYEPHTERLPFVPAFLRTPFMFNNLGLLYGKK